jgi:hypothetical protein
MGGIPSAAALRAIASPIVNKVATQLGSRVTIRRAEEVDLPDGGKKSEWTEVATDVALRILDITEDDRATVWGYDAAFTAQASAPEAIDLRVRDVLIVTSSPSPKRVGRAYQVDAIGPAELAVSVRYALIDAPIGALP